MKPPIRILRLLVAALATFAGAPALAAPATPAPLAPALGEDIAFGTPLVFSWQPVADADRYDLYVYDRVARATVFRDRNVPAAACDAQVCTFEPPSLDLPVASRHVWRVSATGAEGRSGFSHTAFDIVNDQRPVEPVAISPATGENVPAGAELQFSWQPVAGAVRYDLYVYDRVAGATVFRDRNVPASICDGEACLFTPPTSLELPIASRHVWRVAASSSAGRSSFSHSAFDVVGNLPPSQPVPISPTDGDDVIAGTPLSFRWEPAEGATRYDFYVYDRLARATVFRDRNVPASICNADTCTFENSSLDLPLASRHVWRVSAGSSAGRSGFSHSTFDVVADRPPVPSDPDLSSYRLVFSDEFDGATLDASKWYTSLLWGPYLPINNEQQLYVDTLGMHSNFRHSPFEMTGDTLKITATPTSGDLQPPPRPPEGDPSYRRKHSTYRYNGPTTDPTTGVVDPGYRAQDIDYLSGIITSYDSFKMTHGYVEARAKLPAGRGLWPAFWLLPTHYVHEVPEIDVMEFLGQDVDRLYNTFHFFDVPAGWKLISSPSFPVYASDWTEDFHTFGMEWSPRKITWYVDGIETHSITDQDRHGPSGRKYEIPSQAMYLIANLAVGGNWPGDADESTPFPATYELDYIRAYKRATADPINLARDYQIMFRDEFDGSSLDPEKWNSHFLWGPYLPINREQQYYIDALDSDAGLGYSPFSMEDGVLSITARAANDPAGVAPPEELPGLNDRIWDDYPTFRRNENYVPQDFTSGMLTTYDSFKFAYGYAEIRARIPKGDGLWPAFWLLNGYYVGQQPEIDILEFRGRRPDQAVHNYHRYQPGGVLKSTEFVTTRGTREEGYSDGFHTYGARWRPGRIDWYIDGVLEHSYTGDDVGYQLMYVIVNMAVGGGFDPGATPDPAEFPKRLDIDWIRVYQEKDPN